MPSLFFFFNDTATTEIYTLSLHDALPISLLLGALGARADETCMSPYMPKITGQEDYVYVWTLGIEGVGDGSDKLVTIGANPADRKSTRLNSSHLVISYAVFCLKKKKNQDR